MSVSEHFKNIYLMLKDQSNLGFCGIFFFTKPAILITNLDFLKNILIKDLQYFHDHPTFYNLKDDPLSGHLFSIEGDYWKKLRGKYSPAFTVSKIQQMLPITAKIGSKLEKALDNEMKINSDTKIKDLLFRFIIDVIGTCALGIECNLLQKEKIRYFLSSVQKFSQLNEPLL